MTPPIRAKVAKRLARQSYHPTELAEAVGIRLGEATIQLGVLRQIGDEGLGPRLLQDGDGRYLIDPDEAAAWAKPQPQPDEPKRASQAPPVQPQRPCTAGNGARVRHEPVPQLALEAA